MNAFSLGGRAAADESALNALLRHAMKIGAVFSFGYHEAKILTNDQWMHSAHGVPQHCLLLAFPRGLDDPKEGADIEPADREAVLLRVVSEASLPNQAELERMRAEDSDRAITSQYRQNPDPRPQADVLTRSLMQQAAFRCRVLGTFVENDVGDLVFGKDVDAVYAAGGYVVAKPYGESLQRIVDHVELPMGEREDEQAGDDPPNAGLPDTGATMVIGRLRYASSRRREWVAAQEEQATEVEVRVRPRDFVAHKTAVFGMTRAGKSNTMKVLAAAVHLYAYKARARVGQLIFDPAGEYAYANRQDGTALAQLGDNVRIYRLGATQAERSRNIRPLSLNFYDVDQLDGCWGLITTFLRDENRRFITNFLAADPTRRHDEIEDTGDKRRQMALQAMYFAILIKAGLQPPRGWVCSLPVNVETRALIGDASELQTLRLDARGLVRACDMIAETATAVASGKEKKATLQEAVKLWVASEARGGHGDPAIDGMVEMLAPTGSASGWKVLRSIKAYHSAESTTDFAQAIYADLARGRLVIVDLARGSEEVLQTCAERVIRVILAHASERFRDGKPARPMQIFLEEAHRLLNRDKFNKAAESNDPYIRLAKESAKYKIGMIYATQEVSSVDEMILSNTANWVCAYMNNAAEAKKLASYYDFEFFTEQILTADDRGFVRLRTDSSPYTLPVQVAKFDLALVNSVRRECGMDPVQRSTDFAPELADAGDSFDDCPDPDEIFARLNRQAPPPTLFGEDE